MYNVTFLTEKEINDLEIFKKYGRTAALSDFCICLGAHVSNYHTSEGNDLKDRTGWYWTKTPNGTGDARAVAASSGIYDEFCIERNVASRPALTFSDYSIIPTNLVRGSAGLEEIAFGEYPQTVATKQISNTLEMNFNMSSISETGKLYTVDSVEYNDYKKPFTPIKLKEYVYNNNKYVRAQIISHTNGNEVTLSNGEKYMNGQYAWFMVEPIIWFKEPGRNICVAKRCLYSGVRFNNLNGRYSNINDFPKTEIDNFQQNYFVKEILPSNTLLDNYPENSNPYELDFNKVSEEEIIKACIDSDIPVFLHSQPGDGKSSRTEQIDTDCEVVSISTLSPELLVGLAIKNPGEKKVEYLPPPWYVRFCEKCNKQPDKLHVLFLDELTNATPNMQKYAYSIAFKRKVNDFFVLPKNSRIVAAGNETEDSMAAYPIAEPLYDRFAHVYIKTSLEKWLIWALDNNIHPAIIKFVGYGGESVLRTKYTGKSPNADPRKWEMASKMLYKTNNPMNLRSLIGVDLTNQFCAFCRIKLITLEDVLNDNYDDKVFSLDISVKYATVIALLQVSFEDVEKVRDFVCKLGAESVRMFDSLWSNNDPSRLKKIAMLRLEKQAANTEERKVGL